MEFIRKETEPYLGSSEVDYYYKSENPNADLIEELNNIQKKNYEWTKCIVYFDNDDAFCQAPYEAKNYDCLKNALTNSDLDKIDHVTLDGKYPDKNITFWI